MVLAPIILVAKSISTFKTFLLYNTHTLAAQGRIKLAWGPWLIFRAGPLALVVGVEVARVEG